MGEGTFKPSEIDTGVVTGVLTDLPRLFFSCALSSVWAMFVGGLNSKEMLADLLIHDGSQIRSDNLIVEPISHNKPVAMRNGKSRDRVSFGRRDRGSFQRS